MNEINELYFISNCENVRNYSISETRSAKVRVRDILTRPKL